MAWFRLCCLIPARPLACMSCWLCPPLFAIHFLSSSGRPSRYFLTTQCRPHDRIPLSSSFRRTKSLFAGAWPRLQSAGVADIASPSAPKRPSSLFAENTARRCDDIPRVLAVPSEGRQAGAELRFPSLCDADGKPCWRCKDGLTICRNRKSESRA
jgi:hypothetical protein